MRVRTIISGGPGGGKLHTAYWQSAGEDNASATVITNFMGGFWTALVNRINSSFSMAVQGAVDVIDPATGVITGQLAGVSTTVGGQNVTDLLPAQAQGGVRLNTTGVRLGRHVRGRWFIPGPCENDNIVGAPAANYPTALNTAMVPLVGPGGAATQIVVWARPRLVGGVATAGAAFPVVSASASNKWFTLNSRRD